MNMNPRFHMDFLLLSNQFPLLLGNIILPPDQLVLSARNTF